MSKKKLTTDGIYFTGNNAVDVTGSQIYIRFGNKQILLECGLYQSSSNSYLDSYNINTEKFKFDPKEIDYVFINHTHIDHVGLVPRLVAEGFHGRIITTSATANIAASLLLNSAFILNGEAKIMSKTYKRKYDPVYVEKNVYDAMALVDTYDDFNTFYQLDDNVSFKWLHNSHCLGATQLELVLMEGTRCKKILYSSDIGGIHTQNHYVHDLDIPEDHFDYAIMESTYGSTVKKNTKDRNKDIEHLKAAIDTTLEKQGTVILPSFSFARTEELLTTLYEIYGNDSDFHYPIIVDSKLSCEIAEKYNMIIPNNKEWHNVYNWTKVKYITDKTASNATINDERPKVIISSSGFCTNGRVVGYLSHYLPDEKSMVIFSGYTGDNPSYLSYKIQNYKDYKNLTINKVSVLNKAQTVTLSTFSSHANQKDLIEYGSSLNTNKLILVHGSAESKAELSEKLTEAISKKDKTFKVAISSKDMVLHL